MATRRWSSKRMRIRSGLFCGSIYWVLLVSGRVSVPKPLSQIQRSTRCLLQGLSPRPSFGGFGLREAAHHLNADELRTALDRHFGLDNLRESNLNKQADGCTIAALLMMNAAMLHQRIANGRWLSGVSDLAAVKNDVNVVRRISREWDRVMRHDFRPVLEPAVEAIQAIEDTGKLTGLERALRHIATEAERIAETYADMGADHAGPLFNKVMGNQASDGAYFTRPVAASIAARLTLDACGDVDWTDPAVWRAHKTVDLACGSGTLLAAILTDVNCRAKEQGATEPQITALQKLAVEETIKGLDINPVSLQLAASQLTAGNHNISYRQMGLHLTNGWGEVSLWPTERIETGDWTPAAWRSPVLAREAAKFANHSNLHAIKEGLDYTARSSMQRLYENFEKSEQGRSEVISVLESKGAAGQKNIESCTTRSRFMGGLRASMYFFRVWMPSSRASRQGASPSESVPPCRLEWTGRCLADSDGAVVDGRVVSIAGVHLCVGQGRLPAPAQTVEVGTWGCPV